MGEQKDIPNPGSDNAIEMGCTCPVFDNCHGHGTLLYGDGTFYVDLECPIHGGEEWKKKKENTQV